MQIFIIVFETAPRFPILGWLLGLLIFSWPFIFVGSLGKPKLAIMLFATVWAAMLSFGIVTAVAFMADVMLSVAGLRSGAVWVSSAFDFACSQWLHNMAAEKNALWSVFYIHGYFIDVLTGLVRCLDPRKGWLEALSFCAAFAWTIKVAKHHLPAVLAELGLKEAEAGKSSGA